jgi:hypothetical protein
VGTGTGQVQLADGRVVSLDQVSLDLISHDLATRTPLLPFKVLGPRWYGMAGYATLEAALQSIGSGTCTVLVMMPATLSASITVPNNVTLWLDGEGAISVAAGATLTIASPEHIRTHSRRAIFPGAGTVAFTTKGTVYAQWWGTNSAALQAALATGSNVCILPGTISMTTTVVMTHDEQMLYGLGRNSILSNSSADGIFCCIAVQEQTVNVQMRDFTLLGNASSEPSGPSPVRGIVVGTNSTGTAHSTTPWNAYALIENVYISGVTPGTTGFNIGIQLNRCNKSLVKHSFIDSIYGTTANYGYGIVCDASDTDIVNLRCYATIPGQGRHAIYFTNTPSRSRAIDCYVDGFENEAFTSNITLASDGAGIEYINCTAHDCMATASGATAAVFAFHGGSKCRMVGCRSLGATRSSNEFGITVQDCPYTFISDCYMENVDRHGLYIEDSSYTSVNNILMNLVGIEDTATYGGLTIVTSNYVTVDGLTIVGPARFVARLDSTATTPNNCRIRNLLYSGSFTNEIENYDINPGSNVVSTFQIPSVPRASLPAAGVPKHGTLVIDDNGAGDRNLVLYAYGERFRIDGGLNV